MNTPPDPNAPDPNADVTAPKTESAAIYRELRHRIIHLALPPGVRLREQALAKEFRVSRTPIRRVLDQLAHEGLVTISPGSGASVSLVDFQGLREVWALRLKIAELVADFVRLPASPEVLARLDDLLERLESIDESSQLATLYDDYHETMLAVMANGPLRSIYDQLYAQTARMFVQMLPSLDFQAELAAIADEIELTRDACRQPSGQRLADVRSEHMRMLLSRVNDALTLGPPTR